MAQNDDVAMELAAMRRIGSAFKAAEDLPKAAQRRVRNWAAEQYPSTNVAALAAAVRLAAAGDQQATSALVTTALALADAVDAEGAGQ